ncbi:ABC transporter ATP-binding protein [[Clostridium] polysaccharolyticum]|uniref:Iron complex transport system ATP-binding protein n=1 Tax=[Clostridium] polysaccharolyticum TaxID=29364 RepID=A0A1H9Y493_9FIRM|nr:ABC transporter ATP-binding protein [[Clostridium] polysaccharolyticum]SES63597.1 iron complex transport system ATP-binding protein [[Clostridium] polysaccharolyticum]
MNNTLENNIEVKNLCAAYDDRIIINDLNLAIPKGKITMIIGANGCGKSTFLKTVARILPAKRGEIEINGMNIKKHASKELARQMAVLPQSPKVPNGLLVKELVAYGRFPYQSPMGGLKQEDMKMIDWALSATQMKEFADRPIEALSGGQRQRAWISMTLAQGTDILLLDEPTTYLDMSHQLEILELLKKLNQDNKTTIVIVLHELNNATKFADHLIGFKAGSVVFEGKPIDVVTSENLKKLYGIDATLQLDETGSYPICVDFELWNEEEEEKAVSK